MEGHNPGGSVKDRAALNMIKSAIERGNITSETTLIEATSGNTGIALAMMAGIYGIPIELVMPSNSTRERTQTMEAFGAKVILLDNIEICRDYAEENQNNRDILCLISLPIQTIICHIISLPDRKSGMIRKAKLHIL